MRSNLLTFAALCAVLALAATVQGVPEKEGDPTEGATYIGEAKCKKCHFKQHRAWKKMKHKEAWDNLPEEFRSPDKKDDEGRACISCHTTGYGQTDRGGFESVEKSGHLLGVQCEACHGPGSKHRDAGQKVMDEKRKEFNEGEKTFIVLKTTNCSNCHNPHINYAKKYGGK